MLHEKNLDQALNVKKIIDDLKGKIDTLNKAKIETIVVNPDDGTQRDYLAGALDISSEVISDVVKRALTEEIQRRIEHNRDLLRRLGVVLEGDETKKKTKAA